MKKLSLLLILFSVAIVAHGQAPDWIRATGFGGSLNDIGRAVAVDSQGSQYIIGNYESTIQFGSIILTNVGSQDVFVAKMDIFGNWLWANRVGGLSEEIGNSITIDNSGFIYITGSFTGILNFGTTELTSSGYSNIFIAKLDINGNWIWAIRAGGANNSIGQSICLDNLGNLYLTGRFTNTAYYGLTALVSNNGSYDIVIAKVSNNGDWLWAVKAGGSDSDVSESISADNAGNSYVTGRFYNTATFGSISLSCTSSSQDIFVTKLDTSGNWIWAVKAGGVNYENGYSIKADNLGNCYITGDFNNTAYFGSLSLTSLNNNSDVYVAKLDSNGNWVWAVRAGGVGNDGANSISIDGIGNLIITGYFRNTANFGLDSVASAGGSDIFVAKLSAFGVWLWIKKAGGIYNDSGLSIDLDDDDNAFVLGTYANECSFDNSIAISHGANDIFISLLGFDMSSQITLLSPPTINFGSVPVYGTSVVSDIRFSNTGLVNLNITDIQFHNAVWPFMWVSDTWGTPIAPGEVGVIHLYFTPNWVGAIDDTLFIISDAVNSPRVPIHITGTGTDIPPAAVQNVNVTMQGYNALISWDAVTTDIYGQPLTPDCYIVLYNETPYADTQYYYYLSSATSLSYSHFNVVRFRPQMYYRVIAYKDYGRGNLSRLAELNGTNNLVKWSDIIER